MEPVLHHYRLGEDVTAFSTTRHGGCSTGAYGAFNINTFCGDDEAHTACNRRLLAGALGVDDQCIVVPRQVHGTEVRLVDKQWQGLSQQARTAVVDGVDALMTSCRGVCIGVSTADCIPVLLYDPVHKAAAAVHAGWRGTVARITEKTVAAMVQQFGTLPSQLRAVVGPGISLDSFEVGQEVYDAFAEAGHEMARIARKQDKWHIDLPMCNRLQLEHAGVETPHVMMSGICTYRETNRFFSARKLGIASGRIYTGIIIR